MLVRTASSESLNPFEIEHISVRETNGSATVVPCFFLKKIKRMQRIVWVVSLCVLVQVFECVCTCETTRHYSCYHPVVNLCGILVSKITAMTSRVTLMTSNIQCFPKGIKSGSENSLYSLSGGTNHSYSTNSCPKGPSPLPKTLVMFFLNKREIVLSLKSAIAF